MTHDTHPQQRAHRGLFSLLHQLQLANAPARRHDVLSNLAQVLRDHFAHEEREGGFFDEVTAASSRSEAVLDALRSDHQRLLVEVAALTDAVSVGAMSDTALSERLERFRDDLRDHEETERRLLREVVQAGRGTRTPSLVPRSTTSFPPMSARSNRLSDAPSMAPGSVPPPEDARDSLANLHELVGPDELSVVFQPIVDMATGAVFAQEALVRCSDAALSPPPVLFERSVEAGCTGRLGRTIREIGVPLGQGERLFVNIHPQELSEGWLVRPDDPLYTHDTEVYLEITESVPMSHHALCMGVLREVASRVAVHIVVDDLGAGYSNLLRIADLEPSIVKLDRQLVTGIDARPRQRRLVTAIVELCSALGAEVVAEGVETVDEYLALLETGVHYGQGWLFARPAFPIPPVAWPPFGAVSDD